MKQDDLDLLHGYLNGIISDADFAKLQALLRESPEARRTLRGLATVDAKLQELGAGNGKEPVLLVLPPLAQTQHKFLNWRFFATAAACAAVLLIGMMLTNRHPRGTSPELDAAIRSSQAAIARLSVETPAPFPAWASPTASLLEQPPIPK